MFNIALALAFALSFLISPGRWILQLTIHKAVFQDLPTYQGYLLLVFINYWLPAVLAYLVLRLTHAEKWFSPRPAIHALLGFANTLFFLYISARTFASIIEGGGASFVVISFAPYVITLAWIMLATGLVWLIVRSAESYTEGTQNDSQPIGLTETFGIAAAFCIPAAALTWSLLFTRNAPLRLAHNAENMFRERCVHAGMKIFETPKNVQSIYLEPNFGEYFLDIKNGVYKSHSGGIMGGSLVSSGYLRYFEAKNDQSKSSPITSKYKIYGPGDWYGQPEDELTSEYGVFQKSLVNDNEGKKFGIRGTEITIKNLRNDHIVATLIYYSSRRTWSVCGPINNGRLDTSDFVRKALNLTPRFPRQSSRNAQSPKPKQTAETTQHSGTMQRP